VPTAHVHRADEQGLSAHSKFGGLFPRGTSQSPDAKFIFESIVRPQVPGRLHLPTPGLHILTSHLASRTPPGSSSN
jgi:hypothetical protein